MENTLIVIDGPTASGKSNLAFEWAQTWNCPIISADSRQLFQKVNIGTGKPSAEMLLATKHYFIDSIPIDSNYSVGQFVRDAEKLIEELFLTNQKLIVCGGTGLYIKSILKGLDNLPESSDEVKQQVKAIFKEKGLDGYRSLLSQIDPDYYKEIDLSNPRRLERAIEVYFVSGKPFSSFRVKNLKKQTFDVIELTLNPKREFLYQKINKRVDEMIERGLVHETKQLLPYRNCQSMNTVGYKEILSFLDGHIALPLAIDLIKQHTRNYAKRQMTWFKKESQGNFFDPQNKDELELFFNAIV